MFKLITRSSLLIAASAIALASPAQAEIDFGINSGGINNVVCLTGDVITTFQDPGSCAGTRLDPTRLAITGTNGSTVFDATTGNVNFNSNNVSFNSTTTAFGGGTATFNNAVSFTGPSVTFDGPADFNDPITTAGISNFGNIATSSVTTGTATFSTSLTVGGSATVNLGGNRVQGVANGTAGTDAVNLNQLNAATSGITTDVTAIQAVNATQTTQINDLQTVNATQTTQITTLQSNLGAESAARIAADAALDTRTDALEAIAAGLDERFDDVENRSDAGTATAVALSGAMFLPGKSFNLTANMGAYRGAVAGALQFGALVSEAVAVNAGVAHGFNKGGKTALRAGFSFGW